VLVPPIALHVELVWELPFRAALNRALTEFSRLILFDKRGTGPSDPVPTPATLEERMDDNRAVLDAVGGPEADVFAVGDGCQGRLALRGDVPRALLRTRAVRSLGAGSLGTRLPARDVTRGGRAGAQLERGDVGLAGARQVFAVVAASG